MLFCLRPCEVTGTHPNLLTVLHGSNKFNCSEYSGPRGRIWNYKPISLTRLEYTNVQLDTVTNSPDHQRLVRKHTNKPGNLRDLWIHVICAVAIPMFQVIRHCDMPVVIGRRNPLRPGESLNRVGLVPPVHCLQFDSAKQGAKGSGLCLYLVSSPIFRILAMMPCARGTSNIS
jgi:hypothetical protein